MIPTKAPVVTWPAPLLPLEVVAAGALPPVDDPPEPPPEVVDAEPEPEPPDEVAEEPI